MGNDKMTWTSLEAERVRTIEVKQDDLQITVASVDAKLDELLALKNKGMGAFWLASILIGAIFTGLVTFISNLFHG